MKSNYEKKIDLEGNIGEFCKECKRMDFLPTKCINCNNWYCNECFFIHKQSCKSKNKMEDIQLPQCPLCNKFVSYNGINNRDPNKCIDIHIRSGCKLNVIEENNNKICCTIKGCKKKDILCTECKRCKKFYCIEHRFHKCT